MSAPVSLLLDCETVSVVSRDGAVSRDMAWSPGAPAAMVDAVRALVGRPSAIVVVIGLGFLEVAQPDVPPMALATRRALLWRDADRYFPLDEPVAVVWADGLAMAMSAQLLDTWIAAIATWAPVRAIVTAPQLCAGLVANGPCTIPAAPGERGTVQLRDGHLVSARRVLSDAPADDSLGTSVHDQTARSSVPLLGREALGREALRWIDAPLDAQLLDAALALQFHRVRQRRWMTSVVLVLASVLFLLWSADRWRGAQLARLEAQVVALEASSAPAMRADARRSRAQREMALLAAADTVRNAPDAPLAVLAQLSRLLPKDAFVQRLEWDGSLWRVDGTADNARRLVPLLDGDTHFRDVRIASPSQRFLDAGQQRESFAISFRMRLASGGTHGTR